MVGPGTTTGEIMKLLEVDYSLLGMDLVRNKELLGRDLSEGELLALIGEGPARIIVTPVGGQGFLFGRGNQPISARVIRRVGKERIIIVATPDKLGSLRGEPLRVDSGDIETDRWLAGYHRIVSGAIRYQRLSRVAGLKSPSLASGQHGAPSFRPLEGKNHGRIG